MFFKNIFQRGYSLRKAVCIQAWGRGKKNNIKALFGITGLIGAGYLFKHQQSVCLAKGKPSDKSVIAEADKLYANVSPRELYEYLKQYENRDSAEILWRLSRAARDVATTVRDISNEEKKSLIYEAFQLSKRSLDVDNYNFASHKWFAITLGDVGDYEGVKVKISNAYLIKDHLEMATKLNPTDATTLHCLGMWCYVFADMPGYQHWIAGMIFTTPPSSTYHEAAEYFMQAERVDPNFYSVNLLMLGKCYIGIGDTKKAMLFLDRAWHYPASTAEDEKAKHDAEVLLKDLIGK